MTVSSDVLSGNATELRQLAGQLRRLADQCEHVLDSVMKLDSAETWQGPFASRACTTLATWKTGVVSTAHQMRATAASWDKSAASLDNQAADAKKAEQAKKDAEAKKTAAAS